MKIENSENNNARFKNYNIKKVEKDDLFTLSEMDKYHFKEFAFGIFGFHKYLSEALVFEKVIVNEENVSPAHSSEETREICEETIAGYYILQKEVISTDDLLHLSDKIRLIFQRIKSTLLNLGIRDKDNRNSFYDFNERWIHNVLLQYLTNPAYGSINTNKDSNNDSNNIEDKNSNDTNTNNNNAKKNYKTLHLISILVNEVHQNNGIGTFIINRIKNFAMKRRYDAISLEVFVKNEKAIRFYERNGFIRYKRIKKYYNNQKDAFLYIYNR